MKGSPDREYWDRKIIDWEDSWQGTGASSVIERIAARFRAPLVARSKIALELLRPVNDAEVLELGCGSGFFALGLLRRGIARRVTGIDISRPAIERARRLAVEEGLSDRATFMEGDVLTAQFPHATVTVGLGLLDYLSPAQVRSLLERLPGERYLFTFSERIPSARRALHKLYMAIQRCPQHFYMSEDELMALAPTGRPKPVVKRDSRLSFGAILHNLS